MHIRARSLAPTCGILCALILGAACSAPEHSVEAAPGGVLIEHPEALARGGDRSVERHLATVLRSSEEQDGRRVLELEILNTGEATLEFAYTIEWLDRGGRALAATGTPWRRLTLGPGATAPLRVTSPGPEAESWRLRAVAPPR